jgi:ABC-type Zn2+ transport system substrate-binding protein/surface adhesin
MDDTQDLHHQEQLDQQEQDDGATSVYLKDEDDREFHLHVWGTDGTVFFNTRDGRHSMSIYLTAKNARIIAQALVKAAEAV